jgi:hypothetical protein
MVQEVMHGNTKSNGGDVVEAPFISVAFQRGLPREVGINGCRIEDVVDIAVQKLAEFQNGPLACEENAEAIRYLKLAKQCLYERIQRRQEQGVWNTMSAHETHRTEDSHEDFSATGA